MKVALGVGGGIAAYKAAEIVRLLQDRGIRVQVVMTQAAQQFLRPLTFAALSGEKVITDMFAAGDEKAEPNIDSAIEHIAVAQSVDVLLVVPATADLLAKFAQGIANDFLTTLYLAPVKHFDASGVKELAQKITAAYQQSYDKEPFVRLLEGNALPDTKNVEGTNVIKETISRPQGDIPN